MVRVPVMLLRMARRRTLPRHDAQHLRVEGPPVDLTRPVPAMAARIVRPMRRTTKPGKRKVLDHLEGEEVPGGAVEVRDNAPLNHRLAPLHLRISRRQDVLLPLHLHLPALPATVPPRHPHRHRHLLPEQQRHKTIMLHPIVGRQKSTTTSVDYETSKWMRNSRNSNVNWACKVC